MDVFPIQVQKKDIGNDDKKKEELKVKIHRRKNRNVL